MAPAPLPNDFGGHLANWLRQQGYAMPATAPGFSFGYEQPGATSTHDRGILFNPAWREQVMSLAGRYGKRGPLKPRQVEAFEKLLHEMLHQPLVQREPGWYGAASNDQRLWEEAAAEQASQDLLPAALKQLFGFNRPLARRGARALDRDPVLADRTARQRAYRQWSTLASGSSDFQKRPARLERRDFLNASTDERGRMLASVPMGPARRRQAPGPDRPPGY